MDTIISSALAAGRTLLLEHELLDMLQGLGLAVPGHRFVPIEAIAAGEGVDLDGLDATRGVVKVVSEQILHKSDVGGVRIVEQLSPRGVIEAGQAILGGLPPELRQGVMGVVVEEAIAFEGGLGQELLLGVRHTDELGLVYTVGFGGTHVEAMAAATRADQATILFKPGVTTDARLRDKLQRALFFRWATGGVRGVEGVCAPEDLVAEIQRWVAALEAIRAAVERAGASVTELELNPLVWSAARGSWVPVDALLRLGPARSARAEPPLDRLVRAISPGAVALMGVSSRGMNVGRIILRCMQQGGYPADRTFVIRDDVEAIDGVPCVASIDALPREVDLLVLSIAAPAVPGVLAQAMASGKVGAVLLIPGGMGETEGGRGIEQQIVELVDRQGGSDRPVLIGNNSLGLVSHRAGFDSLFIPREKLPRTEGGLGDVALISQSGAFMITRMSKLDYLNPAYQISLGNQIDARISHFVEAVAAAEDAPSTFAVYIEGFKPGDGERLASLVRRLVGEQDRDVILYKAGRSSLGRTAAMGHTASIAGDYRVFADLMTDAGALVAGSLDEFLDLVRVSSVLHGRRFAGRRVALLSNAGYESVAMADNHRGEGHALTAATLSPRTVERIGALLDEAHIGSLVTVHNPLDITPMADDAVYDGCQRAILDDPGVDAAVFGNVPLSARLQSLPRGVSERDVFDAPRGYANLTIELFRAATKPFVVVIDAGRLYDSLAFHLQDAGVPVFRSGDVAVRTLGRYVDSRLAR